jgi:hypothetical protein
MKVFLLGLDGLEYETVIQEKCIQLMQNQFGKIVVPIDREYGFPRSPTVWASFLTGTLYQCDFKYSPIQKALYRFKKSVKL